MKAQVILSVKMNMDVPNTMDNDHIEGAAYWLIQPFLEQFVKGERFNKCMLEGFDISIESADTKVWDNETIVDNETARLIELEDDESEFGGKAFSNETLDEFITELSTCGDFEEYCNVDGDDVTYNIPLNVVNDALTECGCEKISKEDIERVKRQLRE